MRHFLVSISVANMPVLNNPAFAGLAQVFEPNTSSQVDKEEIEDDISGEQETVLPPSSNQTELLEEAVLQASKGVGDGTDSEYRRYIFINIVSSMQSDVFTN